MNNRAARGGWKKQMNRAHKFSFFFEPQHTTHTWRVRAHKTRSRGVDRAHTRYIRNPNRFLKDGGGGPRWKLFCFFFSFPSSCIMEKEERKRRKNKRRKKGKTFQKKKKIKTVGEEEARVQVLRSPFSPAPSEFL